MSITFKTKPFPHQLAEFELSRNLPARALFFEMGLGKSFCAIVNAAHLYAEGKITGMLVVAPSGVHRNWVDAEIPAHMPDDTMADTIALAYNTNKADTRAHQAAVHNLTTRAGFSVLSMSYDGLLTARGKQTVWDFLRRRPSMYVVDEGRRIKNPKAKRTKAVIGSGKFAPYRRLLNGTPISNGPFDLYSQMLFLDADFWKPLGVSSEWGFRNYFGSFKTSYVRVAGGAMREFKELIEYRNLDILKTYLDKAGKRLTKEEVLDLPPKLYSTIKFTLAPAQQAAYDQMVEEYRTVLASGEEVDAELAIVRMLRLQQITSGYLPTPDGREPYEDIGATNPRITTILDLCEDVPHSAIIWCRFRRTIDKLCAALGTDAVRYDGLITDEDEAAEAVRAFQAGEKKFFVSNPAKGGEGLTLHRARTVIRAENSYNLAERLQSDDRAHRIGQKFSVQYIDVCGADTVDERVAECLRKKQDVANIITGDRKLTSWLL
jgi:SNF2 family DNA or RNA helicase